MEKVTENVFVETKWRGANAGLVLTAEGVVLIDIPPDIDNAGEWSREVEKHGKIRFLINTELHHDHWVTNSIFDAEHIITHKATRDMMLMMDHDFIRGRTSLLYAEPFDFPDNFELRLPDISFTGDMTFHLGGKTFQLIHTPGHSEGQIAVYLPEEKVLFTADSVSNKIRTPYHDAIMDDRWLDSLKRLEALNFNVIVPGHGGIMYGDEAREALKSANSIVKGFLELVKAGKADGVKISEDDNRKIDPYYETQPIGIKHRVTLAPSS